MDKIYKDRAIGSLKDWLYEFTDDLTNKTAWEATAPTMSHPTGPTQIKSMAGHPQLGATKGDEVNV